MAARRRASVSFRCHGHASITATHTKTLEFTRERDVTARATCIVGVGSDHDDRDLLALRGAVEVTIEAGGRRDAFEATVTPFFTGDASLVFRRGPALRGRTFAAHATKAAAGLDRDLARALGRPGAPVEVTIRELGRGERRGVLFVVATPIGNDDDLSPRARRTIEAADVVLAEDTRTFRDLARRTGMRTRAAVISYHEHNETARAAEAIVALHDGARVVLVSDAGTPLLHDPGYVVVQRALEAGIDVTPVPGPASPLAVLSVSGLAADRFTYAGFIPRRAAARQAELRRFAERGDPFVVHEAPHRVGALLEDLVLVCGDWEVCAGREVTKVFEEFTRGQVADVAAELASAPRRGEYTLVVAPPHGRRRDEQESAGAAADDDQVDRLLRALLAAGVTARTLAQALATLPGVNRRQAYSRVLGLAPPRGGGEQGAR